MSQLYQHQLQPFEENQSPSPTYEAADPFSKLHLARSRSSRLSNDASSPSNPLDTLHRQLSGDPDAPPPAWKRRASFTQKPPNTSGIALADSTSPTRGPRVSPTSDLSPRPPPPPSISRRHPQLQMTTAVATRPPIPSEMFSDSPIGSSTSLYDPALAPPQPAFLRKSGGTRSNRSSIHSTDTNGMTSEDLWNLDAPEPVADLSNPQRSAMERPLDTVRRLSQRSERRPGQVSPYSASMMPVDFMWPTAPPEEEPIMRRKSKSTTNVPSLAGRTSRIGRKKGPRQTSADPQVMTKVMDGTSPTSPDMPRSNSVFISSAHSSSTDLTKGLPHNKSQASLGARPPSTYYSRDFLSQLAPREGGYAIAAMLSSPVVPGQNSAPAMSAEEKRRSANLEVHRGSRPPTSRSAGMARWSLDGGEHYNRPYPSTSSANTTSSNLSAPPINSPNVSPPADEIILPEGASPPFMSRPEATPDMSPTVLATTSAPIIPSPLSRAVTQDLPTPTPPETDTLPPSASTDSPSAGAAAIPIPPIPASPPRPVLSTKQSKKQLAKEAKAAEKAESTKLAAERATKMREEAARKQAEKDKAKEMKEAAKRKEKEDKERRKAEKKAGSSIGLREKLKSPSQPRLDMGRRVEVPPVPAQSGSGMSSGSVVGVPFPATMGRAQSTPGQAQVDGTRRNVSMPARPPTSSVVESSRKPKLGLFGTLRKRFSTVETPSASNRNTLTSSQSARAPVKLDPPTEEPRSSTVGASASAPLPISQQYFANPAAPAMVPPQPDFTQSPALSDRGDPLAQHQPAVQAPVSPPAEVDTVPTQVEDLPPRTTSIHQSPPRGTAAPSPPASGLRPRNSIQGPRPMPRSGSITSRNSMSHASPPLLGAGTLESAGSVPAAGSESGAGLSQVQSHHTSSAGTYDSRESMSGSGSGASGSSQTPMTSEGEDEGKSAVEVPERGDSADTVRAHAHVYGGEGVSVAAH
ncbi:uncharacterized protein MKK02DRAFT_41529 [Dioszegia hungarica]|uniref:Uncharacterized protein n=1 Tax=Dioszegia hungarica TaxID=4972 RepID=A0AA38H0C0_9TREE|nr:uncharacterized protein MKK02DRAFT_41529 [Dioszegia hungarica]KAI9631898.1 hypothetical protein MKK02DRAFT_41529 [Dioszegia hungarica]